MFWNVGSATNSWPELCPQIWAFWKLIERLHCCVGRFVGPAFLEQVRKEALANQNCEVWWLFCDVGFLTEFLWPLYLPACSACLLKLYEHSSVFIYSQRRGKRGQLTSWWAAFRCDERNVKAVLCAPALTISSKASLLGITEMCYSTLVFQLASFVIRTNNLLYYWFWHECDTR